MIVSQIGTVISFVILAFAPSLGYILAAFGLEFMSGPALGGAPWALPLLAAMIGIMRWMPTKSVRASEA